jgi:hypothetical protein
MPMASAMVALMFGMVVVPPKTERAPPISGRWQARDELTKPSEREPLQFGMMVVRAPSSIIIQRRPLLSSK